MNRALLLDRDGVINEDYGHVFKIEDFVFVSGIFELIKKASELNMKIFVITNQAGIGRGLYNEDQFLELNKWMCQKFIDAGTPIDKVYFCPTHPVFGIGEYKKIDEFRKPAPGMILQARDEYNLDLQNSILIGDKPSDIIAGNNANVGMNILIADNVNDQLSDYSYKLIGSLDQAIPLLQAA